MNKDDLDPQTKYAYQIVVQHSNWGAIIGAAVVATPEKRIDILKQGILQAMMSTGSDRYQVYEKSAAWYIIQKFMSTVNYQAIWDVVMDKIQEHDFTWRGEDED